MPSGRSRRRQGGAALIAFALVLVLSTSWMLVSSLNKASSERTATARTQSGAVLKQAKDALIGYVVVQAATTVTSALSYRHPGRFPCPEAAANAGGASEGIAATSCTLPAIGRLPWRTLGIDKLTDGAGEPLWYVLSSGWSGAVSGDKINSNTQGQLTLDGAANAAIALIIAPGAALDVQPNASQMAAGCTGRTQRRDSTFATAPNFLDYLECMTASAPGTFVTSIVNNESGTVFNDQVIAVRTADAMPAIEGVVAARIQSDIVSAIKNVYTSTTWGATVSSTNPIFPFAAPFANPGTSALKGQTATYQGLLPFTRAQNGCVPGTESRCATNFVTWFTSGPAPTITGTSGTVSNTSCSATSTLVTCLARTRRNVTLTITAKARNVGNALRFIDSAAITSSTSPNPASNSVNISSVAAPMNTDASVSVTINITITASNTNTNRTFLIPIGLFSDHAVLNPSDGTYGWFTDNDWHMLTYYAISSKHAPSGSTPRSCSSVSSVTCLSVTNLTPANKQRAILILAGRGLNNTARPNGTLTDYLEGENNNGDSTFIKSPVSRSFNDRVIVIDANP